MKVGDYVRNDKGEIAKIIEVERENNWLTVRYDNVFNYAAGITYNLIHFKNEEEILEYNHIKSSPNIIDLIEVGDYVNGYKVTFAGATMWDNDGNVIKKGVEINRYSYDTMLRENSIESIVTKEQFESMEYKVGE